MPNVWFFDISSGISGAEVSLIEVCRFLSFEPTVICAHSSLFQKRLQQENIKTKPVRIPRIKANGSFIAKAVNCFHALTVRSRLKRLLAGDHPDVFVTNNLMSDFFAGKAPASYAHTVCICRDDPVTSRASLLLPTRDLVIAPSNWINSRLAEKGLDNVSSVSNGIDIDFFEQAPSSEQARSQLGVPAHTRVIGAAAQFIKRKNLDLALDCFETLAAQQDNLFLVLAGHSLYENTAALKNIRSRIDNSPFRSRIQCCGFLDDMRPFYAACDLFVSVSRNEPFGRTPLEAVICGTPALVSKEAGHTETFAPTPELMVCPGIKEDICARIQEHLDNPQQTEHLRKKAALHIKQNFSARSTAQALEQELTALL